MTFTALITVCWLANPLACETRIAPDMSEDTCNWLASYAVEYITNEDKPYAVFAICKGDVVQPDHPTPDKPHD